MKVQIKPIQFSWGRAWDREDPIFWHNKSWQASVKLLNGKRIELYGYIINLWRLRIHICTFELGDK